MTALLDALSLPLTVPAALLPGGRDPSPSPSPSVTEPFTDRLADVCGDDPPATCRYVFDATGSEWLAGLAEFLLARPLKIVLIIAIALLVRALAHRAITRLVQRTVQGSDALRRLRSPAVIAEAAGALVSERRELRAATIGSVLRSIASFAVATVAGIMILGELGLNLAPVIASAGIVGIAIGFGAQNLVRDFLTGIFMILEDQYGVGDVVDAGEATGSVEAVGLRTTRLRDVSGVVWHIRNGEIIRIGNMSQGWSRALLDVAVGYATPVARAREVIKSVADSVWQDEVFGPLVLEEPEVWGVENFGPDAVVVRLVVKTVPLEQWKVARELRERLKARFDQEGIEIPFPQRSIWIRSEGPGTDRPPGSPDAEGTPSVGAPAPSPERG